MKILVLVLSLNESPYKELMQAQQQSWDSVEVEGVRTVYYYGGGKGWVNEKEFSADSEDKYYLMHDKLLHCLKEIDLTGFDFVFRTNSSSYVNKKRLKEFAATLPTEKFYAGWEIQTNDGFNIVSGAGIFMSRDVAEILINEINPAVEKEEDYYIGQILSRHDIKIIDDKRRIDYTGGLYEMRRGQELVIAEAQPYHIRFKTRVRLRDAENMKIIHKLIMK
jgi:hypothetical protein